MHRLFQLLEGAQWVFSRPDELRVLNERVRSVAALSLQDRTVCGLGVSSLPRDLRTREPRFPGGVLDSFAMGSAVPAMLSGVGLRHNKYAHLPEMERRPPHVQDRLSDTECGQCRVETSGKTL